MGYKAIFLFIMLTFFIHTNPSGQSITSNHPGELNNETLSKSSTNIAPKKEHAETDTDVGNFRYSIEMNDSAGQLYVARIFSENESMYVEQNSWAGANAGDRIYKGRYLMDILEFGQEQMGGKPIKLFDEAEIEFNSSREMVYKITSNFAGQPDLLVVTQHGSSNGVIARFFYIRDGVLRPIKINGLERTDFELFLQDVQNPEYMVFQTKAYSNVDGNMYVYRWSLDIETDALLLTDTRIEQFN